MDDDDELKLNRHVAQHMIEHLSTTQNLALTEASAMGRWLTASLLAVNGAGALAVFNAVDRLQHAHLDGAAFVAGILAALASGVLNQKANFKGVGFSAEALAHAILVAHTGEYGADAKKVSDELLPKIQRWGRWPPIAGWVSAALFAAGTISVATDHSKAEPWNDARCRVIQDDMLRSSPRRTDDPVLFQALGCRPQGAGQVHSVTRTSAPWSAAGRHAPNSGPSSSG